MWRINNHSGKYRVETECSLFADMFWYRSYRKNRHIPSPDQNKPRNAMQSDHNHFHLCGLSGEDVGVTSVQDSHGRAAEELTASGAQFDL
jgi:hypothetical protein